MKCSLGFASESSGAWAWEGAVRDETVLAVCWWFEAGREGTGAHYSLLSTIVVCWKTSVITSWGMFVPNPSGLLKVPSLRLLKKLKCCGCFGAEEVFGADWECWFWALSFCPRDQDGWEGGGAERMPCSIYIGGDVNILVLSRWGKMI